MGISSAVWSIHISPGLGGGGGVKWKIMSIQGVGTLFLAGGRGLTLSLFVA